MPTDPVVIRKCKGVPEFEACVRLQQQVWGFSDADLIPVRMFVVADKVGGQVIGSFLGEQLIGFALSVPGSRGGRAYLHSHMLAVLPEHRNSGLGRRMKLAQRDDALARNIDLIEWTFDPLEIKNAFLNIERLGAIARRYNINQYGHSTSPLHGGLPTDRLIAEWWLNSRRVTHLLQQGSLPPIEPELRLDVPAQIYDWKASPETRDRAAQVQSRNREQFLEAFRQGLSVLGYQRDQQGNGTFLLGHWDEPFSCTSDHAHA